MLLKRIKRKVVIVGEEALYPGNATGDVTGGNIDLDTVAGGDDNPFGNAVNRQEACERFLHLGRGECQFFPDFYLAVLCESPTTTMFMSCLSRLYL